MILIQLKWYLHRSDGLLFREFQFSLLFVGQAAHTYRQEPFEIVIETLSTHVLHLYHASPRTQSKVSRGTSQLLHALFDDP